MLYLNRGDGICQKECSDDFQCKTYGEKCIDGRCQPGCTDNGQCKNGNLLRGIVNFMGVAQSFV